MAAVRHLDEYVKIAPEKMKSDHARYLRDQLREIQVWRSAFQAQKEEKSRLSNARKNYEYENAILRKRNEELQQTIEELKAIDLQTEEQRKSIE